MTALSIKKRCKQKGYTLIELLLVTIVIALIASLGVKTYREKAESDRINIASLNIQHILESGLSYNVANQGIWPIANWDSSATGCPGSPKDTDFVQNYLPNESNQNNYGTQLCWSGDDTTNGPQKAKRFWVAMSVGSDSASTHIAQRIAARLPNAIVTNDPSVEATTPTNNCSSGPCYVKAVVAIPSASNVGNKPYAAGAGYCDPLVTTLNPDTTTKIGTDQAGSGAICRRTMLTDQFGSTANGFPNDLSLSQYQIEFQCKPGEKGDVFASPNFFKEQRTSGTQSQGKWQMNSIYEISEGESKPNPYHNDDPYVPKSCTESHTSPGDWTCTITLTSTMGADNNSKPSQAGCTQPYKNAGICECPVGPDGNRDCGDQAGTIGASYIAMCAPKTVTRSDRLVANQENMFW